MFTGLVQAVGKIAEVRGGSATRLIIDPGGWDHHPEAGESISVSGCCLTLAASPSGAADGCLEFDVVAETLSRTTLGGCRAGSAVNLERSLRAADLLGGHFVQGHVDGVGVVQQVQTGFDYRVAVRPPADLMPFITPKGSIAVDGVSLTIAALDPRAGTFEVALVPTTLARTTLSALHPGDRVNLEADTLAKTIVHWVRHFAPAPRSD